MKVRGDKLMKTTIKSRKNKKLYSTVIKLTVIVYICLSVVLSGFGVVYYLNNSTEPMHGEIIPDERIPLAMISTFDIPIPYAPGINIKENNFARIDYSNANDGYVKVKFHYNIYNRIIATKETPNNGFYFFNIMPLSYQVIPLTKGDGAYTVTIFKYYDGLGFSPMVQANLGVVLDNYFSPFLTPNQFVNYNKYSEVVSVARQLTANAKSELDKIAAVFDYITTNISYDFELADNVLNNNVVGYIPDLDSVLERQKGICFDYAALMTAMLRSQGIPTRMVFGQAGDTYHAWVDVFSTERGWINDVIFFEGNEWQRIDPTLKALHENQRIAKFIGDGINYIPELYY